MIWSIVALNSLNAQDTVDFSTISDSIVDPKYREDQFYVSVTYNLLANKPNGVSQSGFSSGYHVGFIRDMPFNKRRNLAIGLGLGLSSNSFNQTLLISESSNGYNYTVLNDDISYTKNKFTTYLIEFPFEFRWRTSTQKEYDFWRIYTGFKLGYVLYNSSKFIGRPDDIKLSNVNDFNEWQLGLTLSAGYSNVNFHFYYALNNIFDANAKLDANAVHVDMTAVKIGLIFYIL
ncbi:MAG: PorT family protein [Algicola sp.]|nr:PorT family protein [Algicola sp.]